LKKFFCMVLLFTFLAGGAVWGVEKSGTKGHHRSKHSKGKHTKKKKKGKKSKSKGDRAELESQIGDKDVKFNAEAGKP
jgi:hypothetical protein